MRTGIAAAILTVGMAAAAEAQVTIQYTRNTSNSRLSVTYQGGTYSGYGYGYGYGGAYSGYGYGYGSTYPGYGYGYGGSYSSAVAPGVVAGAYHPWGAGVYAGYRGYSYYSGPVRPVYDAGERVPERSPENASALALDQGRKRLRFGDYKGAVDDIRTAVVADAAGGAVEGWFAVALSIWGDQKNADKALRASLAHGFKGGIELSLRDKKEQARATGVLAKTPGEAAAYVLFLLGQPEKLEKMSEKDAALKALIPAK